MTIREYLRDPYKTGFKANVTKTLTLENGYGIVLDRTYFYPEGGGQPRDHGTLDGFPLLGLKELQENEIVHIVEAKLGGKVTGIVNWERRFDHMQHHTGQHLLSQAILKIFNAKTIGWRLSYPTPSIDIACSEISLQDISSLEDMANEIIFSNLDVKTYYVNTQEKLEALPLRKKPNNKFLGNDGIRIVEIEGFDFIPCGGTHCSKTGEIGLLVITDWNRHKNNWRIRFVCGTRAKNNYQEKRNLLHSLKSMLGISEDDIEHKVADLLQEIKDSNSRFDELQTLTEFYASTAMEFSATKLNDKIKLVAQTLSNLDIRSTRRIAARLVEKPGILVVLGCKEDRSSIIIARSKEIEHINVNKIVQQICNDFDGRGGGTPMMAQAGGFDDSYFQNIFQHAQDIVIKNL